MSKGIENLPVFALNGRNVFTDNKLSDCFKMNLKNYHCVDYWKA